MKTEVGCFVINLEKDVERREQISRQLEELCIPYSIFSAEYGKHMTPEEMERHYDRDRAISMSHDMVRSEIGCALSHVFVYKRMVEDGIPYALVLEDDVQLSDDLPKVLSELRAQYESSEPTVVLLTHVLKYKNRKTLRLDHKFRVAKIYGTPVGAYGYFITSAAAKKLLDNLYPVWAVADDWAMFNKRYISVKTLVPYCIGLSDHDKMSNLEDERKDIKLKRGIGYHFYQFFYHKFINQIFVRPFQQVVKQDKTW